MSPAVEQDATPEWERRSHPRKRVGFAARVACATERIPPAVQIVDVSLSGALVAFGEPIGLLVNERVVVSLEPLRGPIHLLGRVVRIARGDDFRTYVAIRFDEHNEAELELLTEALDDSAPADPAPSDSECEPQRTS
jgi:hypothetical protein